MILLLRTDKPESEIYLFSTKRDRVDSYSWQAHRTLSDTLLTKIDQLLEKNGLQRKQLTAIGVYQGPGSFTGLRIGIAVANALAYSLRIPIVAAQGEAWQNDVLHLLASTDSYSGGVVPQYGSPAHITAPRK